MRLEFLLLEEKIRKLEGPIYYMPNPGNWGDALIYWGAIRFFNSIGIQPIIFKPTQVPELSSAPQGSLIFGGGGAWCNDWKGGSIRVRDLSKFHRVLVLPSTFEVFPKIDNKDNIYFRRDHDFSTKVTTDSYFCHDMAFFLGNITTKPGSGTGFFFRKDKESRGLIKLPESNIDISMRGNEFSDLYGFFNAIAQFDTIHTDRLHVSIACSLMNKKCFLYEGVYFKNESVYRASIEPYSDSVRLVQSSFWKL